MTARLRRRGLLLAAPALALSGAIRPRAAGAASAGPFTLGVASGDPHPTGMVLWTRLAPDPLRGGGMPDLPVPVDWVVAEDEALRRPVRAGRVMALPEEAHSVHLEVEGLQPGRWYSYRFTAMGEASATGRTRTAPAPGTVPAELRLAVASCQHYEHGFYAAHRHVAESRPDLVAFLGDAIYEASWGRNPVRSHGAPTARTLEEYRNRHALYRTDADLQAAHAACPWLVTWDDHEVSNDYADDIGERERGAPFLARRAAGYQAFWEHMPLPRAAKPAGPQARIFRRSAFGGLAEFHILDDRQHRHPQPCQPPDRGGATRVTEQACPALADSTRSMLGAAQEAWLAEGLARGGARWTILAQQTRMARLGSAATPPVYWTDGWDGYPAARRRLLDALAARPRDAGTPLVIGGDIHAFLAAELRPDFDRPSDPPAAVEFVASSITSQGGARFALPLARDPHIAFGDGSRRGWLSLRLTRREAVAEMMALDDATDPASGASVLRRFAVEAGAPRLLPG
ncbi:alkaline phosphatase D family protein [Falsiroseomonas sp. CW058]|uniref:alkaline phosphatase D family protein n=1 Tax=Falsiroseomonas sp. CW058 TaxID=3388664 RepID=UPI003D316564